MELIIIRHARSRYNIRETKSMDESITPFGGIQAINVGLFLSSVFDLKEFDCFTSPYLRCLQTSNLLNINRQFHIKTGLGEQLHCHTGSVYVPHRGAEFSDMDWSGYPEEGCCLLPEINEVYLNRIWSTLNELPSKSIIVTHGMPALTALNLAVEGGNWSIPVWDHSIDNCSISYVKYRRKIWHGRNLMHEIDEYDKFIEMAFTTGDVLNNFK